jgi:uncharacterized protein DUF4189/TIR domain-containing protein/putative peptidoglycan binding protein
MLEGMSGKIFINYRRGDEPGFTQALLGRLEQAFPAERLFIDVDNIPPGEDFVRMLESQVAQCDAMLTVIGNNWLDATDERGGRRLDDPHDFVRIEIESALKQGKRVIPVLVHQARMPYPEELPEAIRPLSQRNAVRLTHERFRSDVQGLIKALQGAIEDVAARRSSAVGASDHTVKPLEQPQSSRRALAALGVLGVVLIAAAAIWLAYPELAPPSHEPAPALPAPAPPTSAAPTAVQLPLPSPTLVQPAPVQPAPAQDQAPAVPAAPVQPAPGVAAPALQSASATPPEPALEASRVEVTFWNSIKDEKNPHLFEAYLKRYPDGAFADIARIALEELKAAARTPTTAPADDSVQISDPVLLNELRDRLYELNFDPGPLDGPLTDAARKAIQEFQQQINVPPTGIATMGLLRRLRELGSVKPWASIVYGKDNGKWGMAWNESTRKAAVAGARVSCGDSSTCPVEVSFFGSACGVFAYSTSSWAITARDDIGKAKAAALADCGKRGRSCQIVASVCADGAERFTAK